MAIVPTSGAADDFFRSRAPGSAPSHTADLDSRPATEPELQRGGAAAAYWRSKRDTDTASAEVFRVAAKSDPDKAARANQLAAWTGLPPETIERNFAEVEARVRTQGWEGAVQANPALSPFFADPRNAAAASDDVPALADISNHFQAFWKGGRAAPRTPSALDAAGRFQSLWNGGVNPVTATTIADPSAPIEPGHGVDWDHARAQHDSIVQATGLFPRVGALLDKGLLSLNAGAARLEGAVSEGLGFTDHAKAMREAAQQYEYSANASLPGEQTWQDLKTNHFSPGRTFNFVAEQSIQSLPGMLTAVEGLPIYVATQAGNIGQQRATYNGRQSANLGDVLLATPAAIASAYLERVGGHAILTPAASSAFKRIATAAWKEGATEYLQGEVEYAGAALGTKAGYDDATAFDQALQGAFVGVGMGGSFRGAHEAGVKAVVAAKQSTVIAHVGDMVMSRIMQLAEASKLRKRDPDAFQQFVQQQAAGTPAENIYIPAEIIRQLYQDEGREWTDPEDDLFGAMTPDFREQMAAGLATGGDVVVPTAAAAAHLAGSPIWEAIKSDVRMTPGGFSVNEANASEADQDQTIEALGKRIGEETKAQIEAAAPRQKVYNAIFDGLRRVGYSTNAARQHADVWAERYQTRAERLGGDKTALDLFHDSFAGFNVATPATVKPYGKGDQLDVLINAMRKGADAPAPKGPSLLKRLMTTGGIEDRGGDIAAMGGDKVQIGGHFGRKIQRLIAEHDDAQASFVGEGKGNSRSPDYLIDELQHEGYFGNVQERPSVNDLKALIEKELHGEPVHPDQGNPLAAETQASIAQAADDLRQMLDQRGLDPDKATKEEIAQAMHEADNVADGGRGFDQANPVADPLDDQTPAGKVFYSALERAAQGVTTARASAEQWKATLSKAAGVKREELEWSGLLDWLDMQEGPIARDDVLAVLRDGGIRVEEVVLGAPPTLTDHKITERANELRDIDINNLMSDIQDRDDSIDDEDARSMADHQLGWSEYEDQAQSELTGENGPQFKDWSSDPGNDTYRELLITLDPVRFNRAPATHWNTDGVIAHARFMEKEDAEGRKVLFVEEVQSDWHQKGRDQGYEAEVDPATVEAAQAKADQAKEEYEAAQRDFILAVEADRADVDQGPLPSIADDPREFTSRYATASNVVTGNMLSADRLAEAKAALEGTIALRRAKELAGRELDIAKGLITNGGVPNAPFKSSWPALVMKRMIRWAVDHGYDRVAWTTGEQQADRYNLSTAVGTLTYRIEDDGRVKVNTEGDRGYEALRQYGEQGPAGSTLFTREQAEETFGREIASKFWAGEGSEADSVGYRKLEGSDLRVGGEGMKGFYDRNLVNITNDIIKRYGSKVEKVSIPGLMLADSHLDEPVDNAQPGFEITPKMAEAAKGGFALFQEGRRGRIDFQNDGRAVISLFEARDLSTFLHEGGHLWLEELRKDALSLASGPVFADWETVKAWFKREGIDVEDGRAIPTEAHELWARTTERYFMEGKAPTPTLGEAFATFARWLGKLYKVAKDNMLVLRKQGTTTGAAPINEDIRRVMDRLLATDEAIKASDDANAQRFHFKDAAEANMTDREFGAYQRTIEGSRSEAFAALLEKTMERVKRERTAIYKGQRERMRARVAKEIADRPVFKALAMLRGRDGNARTPMDREGVVEVYGKEVIALLPQGVPPIVARRGIHPDMLAERVGLPDGRTLIEALIGIEANRKELVAAGDKRTPLDVAIDTETETRMAERHGDAFDDGSIEQEALRAIHNSQAADVLAAEARQLAKKIGAMPSSADIVRQWAERYVREGRIVDQASGAALARHQRAERAAGGEFERAMLAGDHDLAFRAKQRQQFAHALYRAASEAKGQVDIIARRLDRLARAKTLKGMDQSFLDQIHGLLEDHDLRKRPEADVKQREKFTVWAKRMEESGIEVLLPERLTMAGNTHFTRMVVGDLVALDDAVQSLAYLGREQKTIQIAERKAIFEEIVAKAVTTGEQQPSRKFKATLNKPGSLARSVISSAVTIERVADFMDAYDPNGAFNQVLIRGARDAANTYAKLGNEVLEPIVRRYMDMPRAQRSRLFSRVTVPEFMAIDPDTREIKPMTMLRMDMIAIALNTGTASNLDKLIRGENLQFQQMVQYQLSEEKLMAALNRELTAEDWKFVEGLWADVGKLWPHIAASEREITGIVPEKVEGRTVETAHGPIKGDYWPVVYDTDPNRSRWANFDANKNAEKDAQTMFGQIGRRIATNKGHTIERTEYAAPMLFSLEGVLFKHIRQVSTRAAYAVWARDALKFLDDPRIEEIVSRKLGREYFGQFHPWLRDQINDAALDTAELRGIDKIMRTARTHATAVGLVLRFTTLLTQIFGVANSIAEIGPGRMLQGYAKATMQMGKAQREAMGLSAELARRGGEFDRDVQAALRDIATAPRTAFGRAVAPAVAVRDRINAFGFALIGMVQLHLVDIPTWIGAYEKGMAEGMTQDDAVNYGDKSVRKAQGASNSKDLAAIQRTREAYRVMTMFYTFFGTVLNYQWETAQAIRSGNYKRAISHSFWVMVAGPLLAALFMSPPEDDEDWMTWAMRNTFFGLWGGVPILRDFANKWNRQLAGQYAGDPQTPAGRIVTSVQQSAGDAIGAVADTDAYAEAQRQHPNLPDIPPPSDRWLQHMIEMSGYLTGLGTGQLGATTQYGVDVAKGDQHPQDVGDVAAGVIKGHRKDQE